MSWIEFTDTMLLCASCLQ